MGGYVLGGQLSDSVTLTTSTSGTMLRPLTGMQTKWAKGLTRGPANGTAFAPAELVIQVDLGATYPMVHGIGAVGLNGVTQSTMIVELSNVSMGGYELATDGVSWLPSYRQISGQNLFWFPSAGIECRYIQITLQIYGRTSGQRYADIRRLLVMQGGLFRPGFNVGWGILSVDMSTEILTPKGGVFIGEEGVYRQMSLGISGMTAGEAKTNTIATNGTDNLQSMLLNYGKRKELIVSPRYYSTDEDIFYNTIYGRFAEWSSIQHATGNNYNCDSILVNEVAAPPLS